MPLQDIRLMLPEEPNDTAIRMFRSLVGLSVTVMSCDSRANVFNCVLVSVYEKTDGVVEFEFKDDGVFRYITLDNVYSFEVL